MSPPVSPRLDVARAVMSENHQHRIRRKYNKYQNLVKIINSKCANTHMKFLGIYQLQIAD